MVGGPREWPSHAPFTWRTRVGHYQGIHRHGSLGMNDASFGSTTSTSVAPKALSVPTTIRPFDHRHNDNVEMAQRHNRAQYRNRQKQAAH